MITAIIVGLNEWERYTLPFIRSIQEHDPELTIVCIDNGSEPRYPEVEGIIMIRSMERRSYAGGINIGLRHAPVSDWYVIFNNDMLLEQQISERVELLDPTCLYGFKIYDHMFTMPYLAGWCYFLSRELLEQVGYFDEKFAPMWFEDADYSIRVQRAGYALEELGRADWGIRHLEDERMGERKSYMTSNMDARHKNRAYLREKHHV